MSESGEVFMSDIDVAFPVRFYVKAEKVEALKQRAREIDDAEMGDHQVEYTVEQAVIVVLHNDPDFLFPCLAGWCHDGRTPWDGVKWAGEQ